MNKKAEEWELTKKEEEKYLLLWMVFYEERVTKPGVLHQTEICSFN
jgi:hypothetical protein